MSLPAGFLLAVGADVALLPVAGGAISLVAAGERRGFTGGGGDDIP